MKTLRWLPLALLAPAALAARPALLEAQARPRAEVCVRCHLEQKETRLLEPARLFPKDVHAEKGLTCLDCHGAAAGEPRGEGFMARPARRDIPALCGRCHSNAQYMRRFNPSLRVDQVTEYYTSVHGRKLRDHDDPAVATCVSCHPAHATRPPSDPSSSVFPANVAATCGACHARSWMATRRLPVDQLEQYRGSVHAKNLADGDLSAPTCNDCHGNHGAAPPGVESVRNVCGQCHSTVAEFFDQSRHEETFAEHHLPGCATCHGNHDIQSPDDRALGLRNELVCGRCHAAGDRYGNEFLRMQALFDSLQLQYRTSRALLARAENRGMEVSQAVFELEDAKDALVRARTAIHTFTVEPVREEIAAGLDITARAHRRAEAALDEHRFRRVGLAGSTSLILVLVLGLWFRIRDIEQRRREKDS